MYAFRRAADAVAGRTAAEIATRASARQIEAYARQVSDAAAACELCVLVCDLESAGGSFVFAAVRAVAHSNAGASACAQTLRASACVAFHADNAHDLSDAWA